MLNAETEDTEGRGKHKMVASGGLKRAQVVLPKLVVMEIACSPEVAFGSIQVAFCSIDVAFGNTDVAFGSVEVALGCMVISS